MVNEDPSMQILSSVRPGDGFFIGSPTCVSHGVNLRIPRLLSRALARHECRSVIEQLRGKTVAYVCGCCRGPAARQVLAGVCHAAVCQGAVPFCSERRPNAGATGSSVMRIATRLPALPSLGARSASRRVSFPPTRKPSRARDRRDRDGSFPTRSLGIKGSRIADRAIERTLFAWSLQSVAGRLPA